MNFSCQVLKLQNDTLDSKKPDVNLISGVFQLYMYPKGAHCISTLLSPHDFSKYVCFLIKEALMICFPYFIFENKSKSKSWIRFSINGFSLYENKSIKCSYIISNLLLFDSRRYFFVVQL